MSPCSLSWDARSVGARARASCSSEVRASPPASVAKSFARLTHPALARSAATTDHADLRSSPEVAKLMAKHGETPVVLFSDEVLKINRRGEAVPRVMLVASNAVYLLNAETHRVHRKLPLRSLGALRMSELSDNFLAIVNPDEYDCLLVCARKIEAVTAMCDARRALGRGSSGVGGRGGGELPVELSLRFEYRAGANMTKIVAFTRLDDGEVDTTITDAVA